MAFLNLLAYHRVLTTRYDCWQIVGGFSKEPRKLNFCKEDGSPVEWDLERSTDPHTTMVARHDPGFVLHPSSFFPEVLNMKRGAKLPYTYDDVKDIILLPPNARGNQGEIPFGQPNPPSPASSVSSSVSVTAIVLASTPETPEPKPKVSKTMSVEKRVLSSFCQSVKRKRLF